MSFGWSASDVANLVQLAWRTYQGVQRAGLAYEELIRETRSLHIVLRSLEKELGNTASPINKPGETYHEDLKAIASGCEEVLGSLDKMLQKYNALSDEERSGRKLYQQVRFGNKEMYLKDSQAKITSYTSDLSAYLNLVLVGSMGWGQIRMEEHARQLNELTSALIGIAPSITGGLHTQSSDFSSHANDDKVAWKGFRPQQNKQRLESPLLQKPETVIQAFDIERTNEDESGPIAEEREDIGVSVPCSHRNTGIGPDKEGEADADGPATISVPRSIHASLPNNDQRLTDFETPLINSEDAGDAGARTDPSAQGTGELASVTQQTLQPSVGVGAPETSPLSLTENLLPLHFEDVLGRKFTFPYEWCKDWNVSSYTTQQTPLH